ncbi:MAG TPA: TetR/AcrR family transcriptional regulator [Burkholderiaceae bacterium]|nr:TetR/AcrR family transcriptional regulator [Burkholderiaceae bacterium]
MSRSAVRVRVARERRVGEILAAALAAFTEHGYDAALMSDIAARCGIVEGTLYKYFDSKRELLHTVLANWYEEMFGDYSRELPGIPGARPKLRYLIWRHLPPIHDSPLLARLMFQQVRTQPDYRGSTLHAMNRRYTTMLTDVVEEGRRSGEIAAEVDATLVRDLVYGGIEHLTWRYIDGLGDLDLGRRADELTSLVWGGLGARPRGQAGNAVLALEQQIGRLTRIADRLEPGAAHRRARQRISPARRAPFPRPRKP